MKNEDFLIAKDKTSYSVNFDIKGRVDSNSAPILQCKLNEAIKSGVKKIVLDMSQVEFLSSAGIRVIIKTYRDITKAGGTLGIEKPSESVKNVLGMAALNELLV